RQRCPAARAAPGPGFAGRGLHGAHLPQRGVPRGRPRSAGRAAGSRWKGGLTWRRQRTWPCRPGRPPCPHPPGGPVSGAPCVLSSPRSVPSAPPTGRCSPWSSSPSGSARSHAWARYPAEPTTGPTSIRPSAAWLACTWASFASFFIGQAILSSKHLNTTLSQPHVLRAVIGGGLFLAVCGLLSFGLGAILRHTAAAITAAIGLLFVLTIVSNFLPQSWQVHVDKWIPANAGSQIWTVVTDPTAHLFSAWTGFGVFVAYAAIAIGAGFILFRKRDA